MRSGLSVIQALTATLKYCCKILVYTLSGDYSLLTWRRGSQPLSEGRGSGAEALPDALAAGGSHRRGLEPRARRQRNRLLHWNASSGADSTGHGEGHVLPTFTMAGYGGTVSRITANKKLTKLY